MERGIGRPIPAVGEWPRVGGCEAGTDLQLVCIHTGLGVVVGVGLWLGVPWRQGWGASGTVSLARVPPLALSLAPAYP